MYTIQLAEVEIFILYTQCIYNYIIFIYYIIQCILHIWINTYKNIFFLYLSLQVCEENHCQEEVFLLSLSYMDRFLACTSIGKNHLQILAAACLLLASKLREPLCRGLPVELLVIYTDNSITRRDLIVSIIVYYTMYK